MKKVKILLVVSIALFFSNGAFSQELNIAWRRMFDVVVDPNRIEGGQYDYHPFQLIDVLVEKPLQNEWLSIGGEFCYGNYNPYRTSISILRGKEKEYYDRSYAMGGFVRVYSRPRVFRLFAQLTSFVNYIQINQPIEIAHDFGVYVESFKHEQWVFSQTLAIGFSLGSKWLRWEPYIQAGVATNITKQWRENFALGSTGMLRTIGGEKWNGNIIIVPLAVKFCLD